MPEILSHESISQGPQGHALVIGVSRYGNLPSPGQISGSLASLDLTRVTCAALSALSVSRWLIGADADKRLPVPLASVRLLLAPSAEEVSVEPALGAYESSPATLPTFDNIRRAANAWRAACGANAHNVAYFYFCGHGIMRDGGTTTLLAQDFAEPGTPILDAAFDVRNLTGGMAPASAFPNIARRQYYFLDCCQTIAEALRTRLSGSPRDVLSGELPNEDDRDWPLIHAAGPGFAAPAPRAEATPFSRALIASLEGGARGSRKDAENRTVWPVKASDILPAIGRELALMPDPGMIQVPVQGGQLVGDPEMVVNAQAPRVNFRMQVDPAAAVPATNIRISGRTMANPLMVPERQSPHPYDMSLDAGVYYAEVGPSRDGPFGSGDERVVAPGFDLWLVRAT